MWPLDACVSFLSCLSVACVSPVIFVVLLLICKSSLVFKKISLVIIGLAVTFLLVVFFLYRVKLKIFVFYENFYFAEFI